MRQVVQVHTIAQWLSLDQPTRSLILQNIKLKARLESWMKKQSERPPLLNVITEKCHRCDGSGLIHHHPRLSGIHPSQIAHPCMLKIYNQMIGRVGKGRFDFRSELIFKIGSLAHLLFQGYGRKGAWGVHYQDEVRIGEDLQEISYNLLLEGSADAVNLLVIDDIPNAPIYEIRIVHEYKTINMDGFKKLTGPKPDHKQQAMIYAVALDCPVVVYMYLNKNDQNIADFPVAFDHSLWTILEDKLVRLNKFYDAEEPPPGTTGYHCKDCEFSHDCEERKRVGEI